MNLPDYDTEIVVNVAANQSLRVDEQAVDLAELAQRIDNVASGRRVKVEVFVWPPQEGREEFLSFVRDVQAQLRTARSPVVTGFHTKILGAA